jgi:hypothetical protein
MAPEVFAACRLKAAERFQHLQSHPPLVRGREAPREGVYVEALAPTGRNGDRTVENPVCADGKPFRHAPEMGSQIDLGLVPVDEALTRQDFVYLAFVVGPLTGFRQVKIECEQLALAFGTHEVMTKCLLTSKMCSEI